MDESVSAFRLAENEVVFRQLNESIEQGFDQIKEIAKEDGQPHYITDSDTPLHFYCECSDEKCTKRILMKPSIYSKIHKQRNRFVIVPGHQASVIEHVIHKRNGYNIVEKFIKPPESARTLNPTPLVNE